MLRGKRYGISTCCEIGAETPQDRKYSFGLPLLTLVVALEPSVPRPKPTDWIVGYLSFIGDVHSLF
jgi:hypothetical protein